MAKKGKDRYKIISEEIKAYKQMLKDPQYKDKKQLKGMIEAREHQLKIFKREALYEQTKKRKKIKMVKNKKYRIEIDNVYPKRKEKYADDLVIAKQFARKMLYSRPQGIARIKELKADGKTYKPKSSHWWAKNRETGRDRIVGI